MRKSKEIKIEELLDINVIILKKGDIGAFCTNEDIVKKYEKIKKVSNNNLATVIEFLKKNKKEIDVEKLALTLIVRFSKSMEEIERLLEEEKINGNKENYIKHLFSFNAKKEKFMESYEHIRKVATDMKETYVYFVNYSKKKNKFEIEVFNSEEILRNKKINNKNKSRLKEINKNLTSKYSDKKGLENILSVVNNEDIYEVFPDFDMGQSILLMKQANEALEKDVNQYDSYNPETSQGIKNVAKKILGEKRFNELGKFNSKDLIDYAKYIDIDKLLLVYAYRIQEKLDKDEAEDISFYKEMLMKVKNNINKDTKFLYKLKDTETDKEEIMEYSVNDLDKCLDRIINNKYLSENKIEKMKNDLMEGNILLTKISRPEIELLELEYSSIEKLMENNLENFICGIKLLNYDLNQIIEKLNESNVDRDNVIVSLYKDNKISDNDIITLYQKSIIGPEFFKEFSEEIDISSEINLSKINEEYLELKSQRNKELKNRLDAKIDIYKIINIEGKSEEEKENIANEIMYEIAETFEDEKDILYYYEKGLLTLGIIADWSGEELVGKLYSKNKIEIADLESLYEKEKISQEFLENIILNAELSLEELNSYMEKGYISEENVIKIFEEKDFYREEAERLKEMGVVSQTAYEIIKNRDIKKIEERVRHKFGKMSDSGEMTEEQMAYTLSLPQISKKSDIRKTKREKNDSNNNFSFGGAGKTNKIIDPAIRYEYLVDLKRRIPNVDYDELDKNNPFYNYEFYIIQEECLGDAPKGDAIVIAERFFKNREQKKEYATDNATYVMRYEDYLILQGKQKEKNIEQKRKVIKEVDGAIYAVNHRTGNSDSNGSWAANVLKAIAKAKSGKSFKKLTPNEERKEIIEWLHTIYTYEELMDILEFANEIDSGEYTYEGKNGTYRKVNGLGDVSDGADAR